MEDIMEKTLDKIVALAKNRGFVYPGSEIYGGLANICVLMIWFYLLAYIFVIGMALNNQKENEDLENTVIIKNEN